MNRLLKSVLASAVVAALGSPAALASEEAASAPAPQAAAAAQQVIAAPEPTIASVPLSPLKKEASTPAPAPEQTEAVVEQTEPAAPAAEEPAAPAAEEEVAVEEQARPVAVFGRPGPDRESFRAYQRARADHMRAAHLARVAMLEESSNRFRDWAETSSLYMDPWGANIEAYHELHRRMIDPWGARITDVMDQQFEDHIAMRGYPRRPIRRHEMAKDWARSQQAAIYDNTRRFHQAWISNLPRVQVAPVAVAPYWPVAPYAVSPVAVAAEK